MSVFDELNNPENAPGSLRIKDFLGKHACRFVKQKTDQTPMSKAPRVQWYLEVVGSDNPRLKAGMEVTHAAVKDAKWSSYFFKGIRLSLAAIHNEDPADEGVDWKALHKETEEGSGKGAELVLTVVPGKKEEHNDVRIAPRPVK